MLESLRPVFLKTHAKAFCKIRLPFTKKEIAEPLYTELWLHEPGKRAQLVFYVFIEEKIGVSPKVVNTLGKEIRGKLNEVKNMGDETERLTVEDALWKRFDYDPFRFGFFALGRIPGENSGRPVINETIFAAHSPERKEELNREKALNVILNRAIDAVYWRKALRFRDPSLRDKIEKSISASKSLENQQLISKLVSLKKDDCALKWTYNDSNLYAEDPPELVIEGFAAAYWLLSKGMPRLDLARIIPEISFYFR